MSISISTITSDSKMILVKYIPFFCVLVFYISVCTAVTTPIYVLGLYPMEGYWPAGNGLLPASELAVNDINADDEILADYELKLVVADTKCNGGRAVHTMYQELYNVSVTKLMVLGCGCSGATEATAETSHYWNLVQVSFAAMSPRLSDRSTYPRFFRVFPPFAMLNQVSVAMFKYFEWTKIAILHHSYEVFFSAKADMLEKAKSNGLNVIAAESFTDDASQQVLNLKQGGVLQKNVKKSCGDRISLSDYIRLGGEPADSLCVVTVALSAIDDMFSPRIYLHQGQLKRAIKIRNAGARIIVGFFQESVAQKVFCAIYKNEMFGAKYVWIVPGYLFRAGWLRHHTGSSISCSEKQLSVATDGFFGIYFAGFPEGDRSERISGMTTQDFRHRYDEFIEHKGHLLAGSEEAGFGYDAVWTSAVALHRVDKHLKTHEPPRSILDFDYSDIEMGDLMFNMMNSTNFEGVTGTVQFTSTGDRLGPMQIEQIQDEAATIVGLYDPTQSSDSIQWSQESSVYWKGGKPPVDSFIEVEEYQIISRGLFAVMAALSSAGMLLACFFLGFNIYYREKRVIKMSSPRLNNLILLGGLLVYLSIIVLGIDVGFAHEETFLKLAKIFTWCLVIGFSLSFGAMFSKTWRVHRIFTTKSVIPKRIRDGQLFGQVAILVILDITVLIVWELTDSMVINTLQGYPREHPENDDILIIPVHVFCQSKYQVYWMGALFVINGLLLVFGAFLAWETRKVTMPALNDSKLIGMSVYTVVIMSFTGVPVSLVVNEPNAHYALIATFIFFSATLTLCLVFVPKVRSRNDVTPVGMFTNTEGGSINQEKDKQKPATVNSQDTS